MRRLLTAAALALVLAAPARASGPSLFFLDARHGWASGDAGLLETTDGGRAWHALEPGRGTLSSLRFVDARHGFAVRGHTLVGTSDGGRTWRPVRRHVVGFVPPWALTGSQKLLRMPGWSEVRVPVRPSSLCVAGPAVSWIASAGRLFSTRDGGRTWRQRYVVRAGSVGPEWSAWKGAVACTRTDVWALFTDGAATSHQSYLVAHSTDGGRTWTQPLAQSWFRRGRVIDAYAGPFAVAGRSAFFVGSCDPCGSHGRVTLTTTHDGGRTFRRVVVATQAGRWVSALSFPDARHGFLAIASNRRGLVLATTDGGRTWHVSVTSTLLRPTFP